MVAPHTVEADNLLPRGKDAGGEVHVHFKRCHGRAHVHEDAVLGLFVPDKHKRRARHDRLALNHVAHQLLRVRKHRLHRAPGELRVIENIRGA